MAAVDYIPVLPPPVGPTWEELSDKFRDRCGTQIRSDDRSFSYKVVQQFDGVKKPHTFYPVTARCSHMSEMLSAITTFGTNLSNTLYLSSFAPASKGATKNGV